MWQWVMSKNCSIFANMRIFKSRDITILILWCHRYNVGDFVKPQGNKKILLSYIYKKNGGSQGRLQKNTVGQFARQHNFSFQNTQWCPFFWENCIILR